MRPATCEYCGTTWRPDDVRPNRCAACGAPALRVLDRDVPRRLYEDPVILVVWGLGFVWLITQIVEALT